MKNMETMEYYGGTYPDPPEYEEDNYNEEDDYEGDMADIYYEESLFD